MMSFSRSGWKTSFVSLSERSEARRQAAELALHVAQLDGPQRTDHGIEQDQQHAILVEVAEQDWVGSLCS